MYADAWENVEKSLSQLLKYNEHSCSGLHPPLLSQQQTAPETLSSTS